MKTGRRERFDPPDENERKLLAILRGFRCDDPHLVLADLYAELDQLRAVDRDLDLALKSISDSNCTLILEGLESVIYACMMLPIHLLRRG